MMRTWEDKAWLLIKNMFQWSPSKEKEGYLYLHSRINPWSNSHNGMFYCALFQKATIWNQRVNYLQLTLLHILISFCQNHVIQVYGLNLIVLPHTSPF